MSVLAIRICLELVTHLTYCIDHLVIIVYATLTVVIVTMYLRVLHRSGYAAGRVQNIRGAMQLPKALGIVRIVIEMRIARSVFMR